jgi:hypothetical protein
VPKKLVVFDNEDEIQTLLDSGQVPYTDLRFAEAEEPPHYGRCAVARMETNGEERKSSTIGSLGMRQNAPIGCVGCADRHLTYDEVHTLLDKELRARLEARPDNRARAGQGHRSDLDRGGGAANAAQDAQPKKPMRN